MLIKYTNHDETANKANVLLEFPWRSIDKDRRIPFVGTSSFSGGGWKTEESIKFSYPQAAFVLGGGNCQLISDDEHTMWSTVPDIVRMLYSHSLRDKGWLITHCETLHGLILKQNIACEDGLGVSLLPPNHHVGSIWQMILSGIRRQTTIRVLILRGLCPLGSERQVIRSI